MSASAVLPVRSASASPSCDDPAPIHPLLPVTGADLVVPRVQGGELRYVNFDYAASAPALQSVADCVAEALPYYSSVHRGAGYASQVSTQLYESARQDVAAFVGARADDVVVFTRNTTDALNLLASAVPGDVVCLDVEHHANLLPWQRIGARVVTAAASLRQTCELVEAELRRAPAALVAVTGASNVTGELTPIRLLADIAHRAGARIVVDAAQLAPHRRIDLAGTGVDYLALSGHKLYAPFGTGALIGRRDWLDAAPPYLAGGGAVRAVSVESTSWATAPERHEAGTPNVLGAVAIAAACRAIGALPAGAAEAHEAALRSRLGDGLAAIPGVTLCRIWADSPQPVGIVSFTVEGWTPSQVAAYLSAEHGIGVRDGKFCAHPLLARLGCADGAVRASIGLGSSSADVDRLVTAVEQLVSRGPLWSYRTDAGRTCPSPETRRLPAFVDARGTAATGVSPCAS